MLGESVEVAGCVLQIAKVPTIVGWLWRNAYRRGLVVPGRNAPGHVSIQLECFFSAIHLQSSARVACARPLEVAGRLCRPGGFVGAVMVVLELVVVVIVVWRPDTAQLLRLLGRLELELERVLLMLFQRRVEGARRGGGLRERRGDLGMVRGGRGGEIVGLVGGLLVLRVGLGKVLAARWQRRGRGVLQARIDRVAHSAGRSRCGRTA
jgi:hypothetical protein